MPVLQADRFVLPKIITPQNRRKYDARNWIINVFANPVVACYSIATECSGRVHLNQSHDSTDTAPSLLSIQPSMRSHRF